MNYNGSIDLLKLRGARKSMVSGQRCIVVPVDDNPAIYVGEKGCYLGLSVRETSNSSYGDSHFVAASISSKETRDKIGRDHIREYTPILGNLKESTYDGSNAGSASGFGAETEGAAPQQPMYEYAAQQQRQVATNPNDLPW